ncbi:MAG: iron-sulfur cluster assembly accessory protein [Candidatus Lightella neohaematopini]|nr:iron-sulfur cluster assembly accessory protein [Candidatus Lightella neohaematopini]
MNNLLSTKINVTNTAIKKIKSILSYKNNIGYNFRVLVTNGGCSGLKYDFTLDKNINDNDFILRQSNIVILIDNNSLNYLHGGLIDYIENINKSYFFISNIKYNNKCNCGMSFN